MFLLVTNLPSLPAKGDVLTCGGGRGGVCGGARWAPECERAWWGGSAVLLLLLLPPPVVAPRCRVRQARRALPHTLHMS
jgi:hypothetical protein